MPSSGELFRRAENLMPGGVSSPVRAFGAVGGEPRFIASGNGSRITDVDGRTYIDLVSSWGPLILGHAHPAVVDAVESAARRGTSFGAPTEAEVKLAELIVDALPSVEMVRFVSSGTEATMSAMRLARAATGRNKIVKFSGCYHGHVDSLLAAAGSGAVTLGLPDSPGVTEGTRTDTVVASYNSIPAAKEAFENFGRDIAAVIVEPVAANMGVVLPAPGFLETLRELCDSAGALLIFDEVVTGFRVGWSGAQGMLGVLPDLTTLGKVIGGGMPLAAYGGRRDLMEMVAPRGPVYQAGTLSGNPVSVAAGRATLDLLRDPGVYQRLEESSARLAEGLAAAAKDAGIAVTIQRVGSMMTMFFRDGAVQNLAGAKASDTERYKAFFHSMLDGGAYLPPSQFEAMFVSLAHSDEDIDRVVEAATRSFEMLGR